MSKELGLRERLVRYMHKNHQTTYVSSGALQKIVMANSTHTARSAVRRLQELYESKQLDRELRKGHAWYRAAQPCISCIQNPINIRNFDMA